MSTFTTYFWPIARPKDEERARLILFAAWHTAKRSNPLASRILIRSDIHDVTMRNGVLIPDALCYHRDTGPNDAICAKEHVGTWIHGRLAVV
ncbi:hypothetical protein G6O67_000097 [Ophiocordyceps sinensis]|uniref:Uncharacterized protein n=1 Tax=Ophiocordyceps sinensis TaxID=72228 RepID=A0A8H4PYI0_9HYPO|nr:hypothetical protein G6O67_000097 [Ophiocordyceps sinensis]